MLANLRIVARHDNERLGLRLPIVEMSAHIRVNVINVKLAEARPVEGPGAVVADHSLGTLRGLGWLGGGLGGGLGGCMGHPITDAIRPAAQPVTLLDAGVEGSPWRTLVLLGRRSVS